MLRRISGVSLAYALSSNILFAAPTISETVMVESPVDTDHDGKLDKIYVNITRTASTGKIPSIYHMSPYALGGTDAPFHDVDTSYLPQDDIQERSEAKRAHARLRNKLAEDIQISALERGYASVEAHSIGTGKSEGCPSVGDETEVLGAKAVIDWLNGRAKGYFANGSEAKADWSNGAVGMTGVSYDGTLPNMVATTGVEGLKAIIPVAAISSWYNYYRSNGLVVGPGGYIGEDADILGKYIVRRGACQEQIRNLTRDMGREHGDYTDFWQQRNYLTKAANVKAAVFIMHGQGDWNVRQRHAIEWWEALDGVTPRRMWLHRGGHSHPSRADLQTEIWRWFDHYVKGEATDVSTKPAVEVQYPDGTWETQAAWPSENTFAKTWYFNPENKLAMTAPADTEVNFTDAGKRQTFDKFLLDPSKPNPNRLAFLTEVFSEPTLLSGTTHVQLSLAVLNRSAANLTVAIVDYDEVGKGKVVTRGWADPQNFQDLAHGELLVVGKNYDLSFSLEPKQYKFPAGHRLGVIIGATDFEHTLRPNDGTKIALTLGEKSSINLQTSGD